MIISVTVNDNDFYDVIMGFMKNMWRYWGTQKPIEEMNSDEIKKSLEEAHKHDDLMKLLNPNCDKKLNEQEQNLIISYLKEKFEKHINRLDKNESTK